ncbi:MAG: hypothetical protein K5978_05530 [Campylobacter sp.]|nr:hypothetical protein [Campylobacter sp.]
MNKILSLILLPIFAFAFSLSVNSGVDAGKSYTILNLSDENDFECVEQLLAYNTKRYVCMLDDDGLVNINDIDLTLMDIRYKKQDGKIFLVILPKANSRLYNFENKLYENKEIFKNEARIGKKFSIYVDQNLKEFDTNVENGVNFAPLFDEMLLPTIGALDFSKAPIENTDSNDIDIYIAMKRSYENAMYQRSFSESSQAIQRYPNSIFASEFLLYRLRSMNKILEKNEKIDEDIDYTNISEEGKQWMRKFSADENFPEVLYLVANSYIKLSLLSDAKYIMDILSTEHSRSNFAHLTMLDYADEIYKNSKTTEARKLYENVLYSAGDLDIASRAALSLASASIDKNKAKEAKDYILKILNANAKYLLNNEEKSMSLAQTFTDEKMPEIAIKIYEIIVENRNSKNENYEVALKNLGVLLVDMKDVDKAYAYLKRYEEEYRYGDYLAEIENALDRLLFERDDENATAMHDHYLFLMKKYGHNDIGIKALLSEIELNFKEKKYDAILQYTNEIKDLNLTKGMEYIGDSALALAQQSIRANDCQKLINLLEAYDINSLELPQFKLHSCYVRTARYEKALSLSRSRAKDENPEDRVEWLIKLASDFRQAKRYEESLTAANDALALGAELPYSDPSPALFDRFYSLLKLDRFTDAIRTLQAIDELRGQDFKRVEAYDILASYSFSKNDFANATIYAKKALSMATAAGADIFSPDLNFLYATAAMKMENLDDALDEARYILSLKLKPAEQCRALNLVADIYIMQSRSDLAKPYLEKCVKSSDQNEYKSLCEASLKMLQK